MISRFAGDSSRRRERRWFALALCSVLCAPLVLAGGQSQTKAGPVRVAAVTIRVDGRPAPASMENLISLSPGDPYSAFAVSEAIKQTFGTGMFSDVEVSRRGEAEVALTFALTRRLLVRAIHFAGKKGVSSGQLKDALVSLRNDSYFSEENLAKSVSELKQALAHNGYFQAKIVPSVVRRPGSFEVVVTFAIDSGSRYTISDITFAGNGPVPASELLKKMKTRAASPYSLAKLDKDLPRIKALYASLGYPRAEVEPAPEVFFVEEGTVSLPIKISTGEQVQIVISGAKIPVALVRPIWEGPIFEEWGESEGEARILGNLRAKGYIFASVRSSIEKIENGIRVSYAVSRGKKYRITKLVFEGNRNLPADEIKRQLAVEDSIRVFGGIDGRKVFELPDELEVLYQSLGFPDVQVNLHFRETDSSAVAIYGIEEGRQRRAKSVDFQGASLVSAAVLQKQISLKEGGPYFTASVQRDIRVLETYYLNQGIRGTRIEAHSAPAGEDEFAVTYSIREGIPTRIQGVFISGNLVTRKSTVMREMKIKAGDPAWMDKIMASRASLEKLAMFSEVRMEEVPLAPGFENLVVRLREGERNLVGLGVGLETRDELTTSSILSANLRPRATAEFMRSNIFGVAANASLVSQFSLAEKRLIATWEQPHLLFGLRVPTYVSAWIEEEDRISFGYKRQGVSISGIKTIFWDLTLLAALKYARTTLYFLNVAPNEIDREFYPYSATSVETSFIREKRDDPFNPTRGYFSSLSLEYAFPLFNTESDFLKMAFKFQHYFRLVPRLVFGSTFRLGLGVGRMPIHERFFAGGSNSFRGQQFDELGPKDPVSEKPVGGKAMVLFNFELVFPLISTLPDLAGAVFYDAGNVFASRNDFGLNALEHAVGGGVRYRTPLGPVRLELAWNLTNPTRRNKPLFFITIGNLF